jgi:hypothetical protein
MAAMRGVDGSQNGLGGGVNQGFQQSGYLNLADGLGLLECRVRAGPFVVSQHPLLCRWVEEWRGSLSPVLLIGTLVLGS